MSRHFQIDELEERIAPSCLSLGSLVNDVTSAVGCVGAADHASVCASASASTSGACAAATATDTAALCAGGIHVGANVDVHAAANLDLGGLNLCGL